jgi:hypothetical protein
MPLLYRILSLLGAIAHLPDAAIAPLASRFRQGRALAASNAQIPLPMILSVLLAIAAGVSYVLGAEAAANPSPTPYTVTALAANPDLGGKIWATIHGTLHPNFVDYQTTGGDYDHTDYLICDVDSRDCLVVVSRDPHLETAVSLGISDTMTFTGMLRSNSKEVDSAARILGTSVSSVHVNPSLVLNDEERPVADAPTAFAIAIVAVVLLIPLFIGWAIGYLVFRPSGTEPQPVGAMAGPLPVRVTGLVMGPGAGLRARQLPAELRPGETSPEAAAAGAPPPLDLYFSRGKTQWMTRLTPGLGEGKTGRAYPFLGSKPAVRVKFLKYKLIFGFDDEASRDRAYEQMRRSSWYANSKPSNELASEWPPTPDMLPAAPVVSGWPPQPQGGAPQTAGWPPQPQGPTTPAPAPGWPPSTPGSGPSAPDQNRTTPPEPPGTRTP